MEREHKTVVVCKKNVGERQTFWAADSSHSTWEAIEERKNNIMKRGGGNIVVVVCIEQKKQ